VRRQQQPDGADVAPVAATPPPPVTTVVAQGSFAGLSAGSGWVSEALATTSAGRLEVTVDWTFARTDLDVYILRGTSATCTPAQFNARQCDFAAFSESTTAKPEKVTVANAPAGTYTILVINWGPDQESFSYQAALTTGGTAASAATQIRPEKIGVQHFLTGR
jgi:hypothetical protein